MQNPRNMAGASLSLGSDKEAPTPTSDETQLHPVDVFAAWSGETERALRMRIHRARDIATARAARSAHGRARALYWIASQFGADWVFRRAEVADLQDVIKGLTWLFLFCTMIEQLELPDE